MQDLEIIKRDSFSPAYSDDKSIVEVNLELPDEEWKRIRFTREAYEEFLQIIVKCMGFEKGKGIKIEHTRLHGRNALRKYKNPITNEIETKETEIPILDPEEKDEKGEFYRDYFRIETTIDEEGGTEMDLLDFSHPDMGVSIGKIVNSIISVWNEGYQTSLNQKLWVWKHNPSESPMKFVWINEFVQRLTTQLKYKTKANEKYEGKGKEYWNEIRHQVIIKADKYMPRYRTLGGKRTLVDEGGVCDDSQLILGLLLSNPKYLNFEDCNLEDFEDMIYVRDLAKKCEGDPCFYHPIEVIWKSKTWRLDDYVTEIPKQLMTESEIRRSNPKMKYHPNPPQRKRELEGKLLAFNNTEYGCRAWIVKEATFCGKYRLTARKVVINRNNRDSFIVTSGIKNLNDKEESSKKDIVDLVAKILGKSDSKTQQKLKTENPEMSEEQMWEYFFEGGEKKSDKSRTVMPLSPRELPIPAKGLDLIAAKILNYEDSQYKNDKEKQDAAAQLSLHKHRLSAKLIEIGQFLEWWLDLREAFVEKELFAKDVTGKYHPHSSSDSDWLNETWYEIELPLKILGSGVRTLFDSEINHEERDIVDMGG